MKSSTTTLISALRILSRDIRSEDGVANAAIAEAADRLNDLDREKTDQELTIATIRDTVTHDKMSDKCKVLAINFLLRKEAQP